MQYPNYYDEKIKEKKALHKTAQDIYLQQVNPSYKGDFHNDGADAFRHAYAAGIITLKYGPIIASMYGSAYEVKNKIDNYLAKEQLTSSQIARERDMDLANNKIGILLTQGCKSEEEFVERLIKAYAEGKLITDPNANSDKYGQTYTIEDMFKSFDETKVLKQDISNKERFLKMADHEANKGKPGVAEMYQNMARQQGLIEDFFKNMPGRASKSSDDDEL